MSERVAVVITVHKPRMDPLESLSLARCVDVLGRYPIVLAGPRSLNFTAYREAAPSAQVIVFDDRFFASWDYYCEFLTLPPLFEAVASYEFMLKYELDAFVFEDQLLDWCGRGWDYIGAPWLNKRGEWVGVGNGGFWLRKVANCLKVLEAKAALESGKSSGRLRNGGLRSLSHAGTRVRAALSRLVARAGLGRWMHQFIFPEAIEDVFWGRRARDYYPAWNLAPVEEAKRFSVESGLRLTAPLFRERPPFGCHRRRFLRILDRFLHSDAPPVNDYEELVWGLARTAGLHRAGVSRTAVCEASKG